MTVTTAASKVIFQGNGATSVFTYSFAMPVGTEVVLYTTSAGLQTKLAPGTYAITGEGQPTAGGGVQGGTLTYPLTGSPIPVGSTLTLLRIVPDTQPNNFSNQSGLWPSVVEGSDDNLELQIQQLAEMLSRALLFNPADTGPFPPLPVAALRAGLALLFDSNGNPYAGGFAAATVAISSVMAAVVGAATIAAALKLLGLANQTNTIQAMNFGVDMSGMTDSTSQFLAAASAAMAVNGTLYIPEGTVQISSVALSNASANLTIQGSGKFTTKIVTNSPTANVLTLALGNHQIKDLTISSSVTRTGGAHIASSSNIGDVINVCLDAFFHGILGQDNGGTWRDLLMTNPATNAVGLIVDGFPVSLTIDNPSFYQGAHQAAAGIYVMNGLGGLLINNASVDGQGTNLLIAPGNGQGAFSVEVFGGYFDGGTTGIAINATGNGDVVRVKFIGVETNSNTTNGVTIENSGSGVVEGIEFIDHMGSLNPSGSGIAVISGSGSPTGVSILGGTFASNGSGISIGAGVTDFTIMGIEAGAYGGMAGNSDDGVVVATGASDRYLITNNRVSGNGVGGVVDGGTGTNKFVGGSSGAGANIV